MPIDSITKTKTCKKEVTKRLLTIVDELLSMKNRAHIAHEYATQWNCSVRNVRSYIKKANEMIVNRPRESTTELINKHIAIREDIYRQSEHSRDKLQCVESIAKLQGLDKTIIEVHSKSYDNIATEDLIEVVTIDPLGEGSTPSEG